MEEGEADARNQLRRTSGLRRQEAIRIPRCLRESVPENWWDVIPVRIVKLIVLDCNGWNGENDD